MRKLLKINSEIILNTSDLQNQFSPIPLYNELQTFIDFATVHCVPLQLVFSGKEARNLTKDFWMNDVIKRDVQNWPNCSDALACLEYFKKEILNNKYGNFKENEEKTRVGLEEEKAKLEEEDKSFKIKEKLEHIIKSGRLSSRKEDIRKALILLAICEISGINALDYTFLDAEDQRKEDSKRTNLFPETEQILTLKPSHKASGITYKFWYHDSNVLNSGEKIKTVLVLADDEDDNDFQVVIEFISERTKKCVKTITLKHGGYCFINSACGKVIKVLPNKSEAGTLSLSRRGSRIVIKDNNIEMPPINEALEVSSFSAGFSGEGFLFLRNGTPISAFYKPNSLNVNNDMKADKKRILRKDEKIVEVELTEKGYKMLGETGTVYSNYYENSNKPAFLNENGRA